MSGFVKTLLCYDVKHHNTPQGSAVALFLGYAAITIESKGKYVLRQPKSTQRTQTTPLVKSFSPIYDSKITIIYEQHR